MRCDKHEQNPKKLAPETVADLDLVLARFPILTIKSWLSMSLHLKRKTS
jgi:hypothetical protein